MTEAAFKACYSEWRMIKTRATVQLVFEIPIEQADAAYQALGGMPIAAKEVWCAIARMNEQVSQRGTPPFPGAGTKPAPAQPSVPAEPVRADKERRKFDEMAPAQQAGILCGEQAFRKFLSEKFGRLWLITQNDPAAVVREVCEVNSRADIKPDNAMWSSLVLSYRLWQREPECVG